MRVKYAYAHFADTARKRRRHNATSCDREFRAALQFKKRARFASATLQWQRQQQMFIVMHVLVHTALGVLRMRAH